MPAVGVTGGPAQSLAETDAVTGVSIRRLDGADYVEAHDEVAVEAPLEIQLVYGPVSARQTKSITVTMRTPGNDEELAAGFLLSEGVVEDSAQIVRVGRVAEPERELNDASIVPASTVGNVVRVELEADVTMRMATLERNFYTTSSCGICGKASLLALRSVCPPRRQNGLVIGPDLLYALPQRLRDGQTVFDATGGLHGAALFSGEGELLMLREDVGRHNAVDKLLGAQLLADKTPLQGHILMLSGRASFELLQKAVMAGISLVAAVGAPSSLAVAVASEFDVTLVGFLRDRRCNVYHGAERIKTTCKKIAYMGGKLDVRGTEQAG